MPIDPPRKRFQLNKLAAEAWLKTCRQMAFIEACDVAMLQLAANLTNHEQSSANYFRMEGARYYRDILETLGELPSRKTTDTTGQLNHNV